MFCFNMGDTVVLSERDNFLGLIMIFLYMGSLVELNNSNPSIFFMVANIIFIALISVLPWYTHGCPFAWFGFLLTT